MVTRFADRNEEIDLALSFRRQLRACEKCPLHVGQTPVPWDGDMFPTYALMGEAPGAEEAEQGRPFVGRAGKKLRAMLRASGINDEKVTYFNSVACRPPGNRNPEPSELAACKPWVTGTLEFVRPDILITVGTIAFHQILGRSKPKLQNMHGKPLYVPHIGCRWMATYHPSATLRPGGKKYEDMILADLAWVTQTDWRPLEECYVCGDDLRKYDEFGIGYCERHATLQGNLFG